MLSKKNNKGITLIALVISIILLLILAGISIQALTNQGLFAQTEEAKKRNENAQVKEEETLTNYESTIEKHISSTREQVTVDKEEYEQLKASVQQLNQIVNSINNYSSTEEKVVGKFYDGKILYEKSIPITIPTTSKNGSIADKEIDLSDLNIDVVVIKEGYFKTNSNNACFSLNSYYECSEKHEIKAFYVGESEKLTIRNTCTQYNGANGNITIQYTKKI